MSANYQLDPFYLNDRRVVGLVGPDVLARQAVIPPRHPDAKNVRLAELATLARALKRHLDASPVPSFEALLLRKELVVGQLFTTFRDFYCSNVGRQQEGPATVHCRFAEIGEPKTPQLRLVLELHRDHVAPGSPGERLSGRVADLYVIAVVHAVRGAQVTAIPLFIGRRQRGGGDWGEVSSWGCEIGIGSVDSFSAVKDLARPTTKASLQALKNVPEAEVKKAFAEIIEEPDVPSDWGGERSDLFSSRVVLNGRSVTTGFVFKGPAVFRPMTLRELGKNGDQLVRLATEPADLLILQHCHEVHPSVRTLLRAICNQVGHQRQFCVVDGYDTIRVLTAYRKCGFDRSGAASGAA